MQSMRVIVPLMLTKVASAPWKVLITAIPSSCRISLNREAASTSLSGRRSFVTACFCHHSWGHHPILDVRHDVERAPSRRVLECLSEANRQVVKRLSEARSTACFMMLRWPVHHYDVFLQVSKPHSPCTSLQYRWRVVHAHHVLGLQMFFFIRIDTRGSHVQASRLLDLTSKCRPWWAMADLCADQSHGRQQRSRVPVRPTTCASIS